MPMGFLLELPVFSSVPDAVQICGNFARVFFDRRHNLLSGLSDWQFKCARHDGDFVGKT
jgi:hypothetical protein